MISAGEESCSIGVTAIFGGLVKDITIDLPPSVEGIEVCGAIAASLGAGPDVAVVVDRTGEAIGPETPVDIVHGDTVHIVPEAVGARGTLVGRLVPVGAGSVLPLRLGESVVVGREVQGPGTYPIDHRTVSGSHATIRASAEGVTLTDRSSNGTRVNTDRVSGSSTHLVHGDVVQFGDAPEMVFLGVPSWNQGHLEFSGGRLSFNRRPRPKPSERAAFIDLSAPPEAARSRRIPTATMAVPVLMGGVMFLVMRNPMFLLFTAMSPTMAIWNWVESRKSGRAAFEKSAAEYRAALREGEQRLIQERTATKAWWLGRQQSLSVLLASAGGWGPDVWRRRARDDDFLTVSAGTTDAPAKVALRLLEGGDVGLRNLADPLLNEYALDRSVPAEINLGESRLVGIVGVNRREVARSIAAQIAVQHSPRDAHLTVLAPRHIDDWEFVRWLPHSGTGGGERVGESNASVRSAFSELSARASAGEERGGAYSGSGSTAPWEIVIFDPPFDLRSSKVSELLESAKEWPFIGIWLGNDRDQLPTEIGVVVDTDAAEVMNVRTGETLSLSSISTASPEYATILSRALAPLEDAGQQSDSLEIPTSVSLLDVLGQQAVDPVAVAQGWAERSGLEGPVGKDADGIVTVDLTAHGDGSHGLVAGTTGAGKSEFLQTLVASLASRYSPNRLSFLFVDYKASKVFADCALLPHSVGVLTNLDPGLADRARRSLKAELERRQQLLREYDVGDIDEMHAKFPEVAMPVLLIVFDEFAQLVADIPEFVDGVVDIAQVGRSLGVQMILATQTPGGIINDKIQNNMKLRVSFRLEQSSESTAVIGTKAASEIPSDIPGRAYVRKAGGHYAYVQTAYAKAHTVPSGSAAVVARTMIAPKGTSLTAAMGGQPTESDLERVFAAIHSAFDLTGMARPKRPWLEELPIEIPVPADPMGRENPLTAHVGVQDLPDSQSQPAYEIDLTAHSNIGVFGTSGAGKATFMRTLALVLARQNPPSDLEIYALEGRARTLRPLASLPHVRAVTSVDDPEGVRRLVEHLLSEMFRRGRSEAGAFAGWLVLIDAVPELLSVLELLDGAAYQRDILRLLADGPSNGIYFVLSTDQPQRVPMAVANTLQERIILRQATREAYQMAGVPTQVVLGGMPPGRAIIARTGAAVQLMVPIASGSSSGEAGQTEHIRQAADRMREHGWLDLDPLEVLPAVLSAPPGGVIGLDGGTIALGLDDVGLEPALVDVARTSSLLISGPPLSGRSTTLEWVGVALGTNPLRSLILSPTGRVSDRWTHVARDPEAAAEILAEWGTGEPFDGWTYVALDDVDEYLEVPITNSPLKTQLVAFGELIEQLLKTGRDTQTVVAAAGTLAGINRAQGWPQTLRRNRQALLLSPQMLDTRTADPTSGVRLLRRSGYVPRPGLGVLDAGAASQLIQVFSPGE